MNPILRSGGVIAGLATINALTHRTRLPGDVVVPVGALALTTAARASGLRPQEMGVSARQLSAGLLPAAIGAAIVGVTVAAATRIPQVGSAIADGRYDSRAAALRSAMITTPLVVAIPEELMFRGALEASLRRHLSPSAAAFLGSALFGAWHILGARTSVVGTVAATGAAGLGFLTLRRRYDSLLPPVAVHWALNGSAALAASRARVTN